jgi:hypothetical protein
MLRITEVLERCHSNRRVQINRETWEGNLVTIEFVIRADDGTVMAGERTFHDEADQFSDVVDFEDELWAGPLYDAPQEVFSPASDPPYVSLWWSVAILAVNCPLALGMHLILPSHFPSLIFTFSVIVTAMVLGTRHALVLALLCPFAHDLFVTPPLFRFSTPTAADYIMAAFYVSAALIIPWIMANMAQIRGWFVGTEDNIRHGSGTRIET